MGKVTAENYYLPSLELVYQNDFEDDARLPDLGTLSASYTTDSGQVIQGGRSIALASPSLVVFDGAEIGSVAGESYVVEFNYRLGNPTTTGSRVFVGYDWTGLVSPGSSLSGPEPGLHATAGVYEHNMRLPETATGIRLRLGVSGGAAVVDSLRVYRLINRVYPSEPNLLKFGFPRLSNFHVFSTATSARIHGTEVEVIRDALGRYDLVNGLSINHTFGGELDYLSLKSRNPDTLILPYHQTFLSVFPSNTVPGPVEAAPSVLTLFNGGLEDEWFLLNPDGDRLNEPAFTTNFQMNFSEDCPIVDGYKFLDYSRFYLQNLVLSSGYWDGIHFDQAEWYPNVLLSEDQESLVPMDLDNDGVGESRPELFESWRVAYYQYFDKLHAELGSSAIFFGNEGEMPLNPEVVRRLNGFQFEYFSPYQRLEDGSYATGYGSFWYRYIDVHTRARQWLRSPQIVSTQMTGAGLGTANGTITENGFADRVPELVAADYTRMRFGLGSSLLVDGFFSYDYVDNSTAPTVWFDEYWVDLETGAASDLIEDAHYLGQPLADAVELVSSSVLLAEVDFESGIPALASGLFFSEEIQLVTDPSLVIEGSQSIILSYVADPLDSGASQEIFLSIASSMPLVQGKTYQLSMDYKVVDYNPVHHSIFLSGGVADFDDDSTLTRYGLATLLYSDVTPGLEGTLRSSSVASSSDFTGFAALSDTGTVIIDNIRLIEGPGGVYRRDFENGIVLVNPTPEEITIELSEVKGPLNRTGIRRIDGDQAPAVNTGALVSSAIVLSPADALILLADPVAATVPTAPVGFSGATLAEGVHLDWSPVVVGNLAGYVVRYGLMGGDSVYYETVGRTVTHTLSNLLPGRTYQFSICSFDYSGRLSDYSQSVSVSAPGSFTGTVPTFTANGVMERNQLFTISGSLLADGSADFDEGQYPLVAQGTQVFVNGIHVELSSVSPSQITFLVPESLGGLTAILRVEKDGISSVSEYVDIKPMESLHFETFNFHIDTDTEKLVFQWESVPNRFYQFECTSGVSNGWQPVAGYPRLALKGYTEAVLDFDSSQKSQFFRLIELFNVNESN